jgi:peroxiredoxin 2/4
LFCLDHKNINITMAILVGKKAPNFSSPAVINGGEIVDNFSLDQYLGKKYVVLFFYPADFTFVCPTEILSFQDHLDDFEKRNVAIVGCSVDSQFSHSKWLQTELSEGGIKGTKYPLVSDQSLIISTSYDVLAGEYESDDDGEIEFMGVAQAYRGLFLIDLEGIVRHQVVNDMPLGRNIVEVLRMVDALQFYEKHGEVCPANWKPGEKALEATQEGISKYLGGKK